MKIKELIEQLETFNPESEIRLSLRKGMKPYGTKPLGKIEPVFDQDSNRLAFYSVDVNIEQPTGEKIIIPENENDIEYK